MEQRKLNLPGCYVESQRIEYNVFLCCDSHNVHLQPKWWNGATNDSSKLKGIIINQCEVIQLVQGFPCANDCWLSTET